MSAEEFDYVIVGAGSAGCVLANRLSADPDRRVLLLEAGPRDLNPFIHMPAGIAKLVGNRRIDWDYYTEPEPQLNGRRLYWPRGRVLGGSSSINAMCYTRGQQRDYDDWARLGNPGWDYSGVLPYFRRAEGSYRGEGKHHGGAGPLTVSELRYRNPLSRGFVDAGVELGLPRNDDFNGEQQEGVGFYDVTHRNGRRCSAAVAYLRPAAARSNLVVRTGTRALRVVFRAARAVGVDYLDRGRRRTAFAAREVLLAAGAIGSPQLLLLSGVGPAEELSRLATSTVADLPGVGANLQDHLDVCTLYRCKTSQTYDFGPLEELAVGLRYLLTRSGPGLSNAAEAGAFARSVLAKDGRPDIQLHFVPAQLDDHGRNRLPGHGFTVHACGLRPFSRGTVRLGSADPLAPPRISPQYLSDARDVEVLLEGIRISRELIGTRSFAAWRGAELLPGAAAQSRAELVAFIRRKAETIYHPVGTCCMGADPAAGAVVDAQLRVHGVEALRVVDASIMPRLISGNTNAPTIMIAERASDLLMFGAATATATASNRPTQGRRAEP